MLYHTQSPADLATVAEDFVSKLSTQTHTEPGRATVVFLHGDLGAGKTTFTKEVARLLGAGEVVQSPTFVIQKSYTLTGPSSPFTTLVHLDLYRLESEADTAMLRLRETVAEPANLVLIEWPEKLSTITPDVSVHMRHTGGDSREVEIVYNEPNGQSNLQ